ncbi:hypothetical protein [Bacillus mycoides]|uniref:DUF4355 domain-containing protein n=1 Tax=Bacillus mycoides TaxID=1405 RepID=A0ABC9QU61_BACMY|nr:hypothetical protein [Bacillus mycoides]EJR28752.1 hypothetical protein III_06089 [Bacillus mycoides]
MTEKHIENAEARAEMKNKSLDMVRGQGPEVDSLEVITEEMNGPKEEPGQPKLTEREQEIHNQAFESHQRITELQNQMKDLQKSRVENELINEAHLYKHYDFGIQYALKTNKEATAEQLKAIDDYIERVASERIQAHEKQKEDAENQAEKEAKEEFKREVEEQILKQHQPKPITNSLNIIQAQIAGNGYVTPDTGNFKRTDSLSIIQRQLAQQR